MAHGAARLQLKNPVPSLRGTEALAGRAFRVRDPERELAAYARLHEVLAHEPEALLKALTVEACRLLDCETAGVSLLERADDGSEHFRWAALTGRAAAALGHTLPRFDAPCGHVLEARTPLLLGDPCEDFPLLADVDPPLVEGLLAPFEVDGEPVGTVWVVAHDEAHRFGPGDLAPLERLARLGAVGYQHHRTRQLAIQREQRRYFLLTLNERLRRLADAREVQLAAAAGLCGFLHAGRVCFAEDAGDGEHLRVTAEHACSLPGLDGALRRHGELGAHAASLRAGRTVVHGHIPFDPRLTYEQRRGCALAGIGASVAVPLVKEGRLLATLLVHWRDARQPGAEELALIETVAERTWEAGERARAQTQRQLSEARFRSTFENAAVGMALVAPDGRWLEVNERLCEIVGRTPEALLACTFADITHPDDLEADWEDARALLAGQQRVYQRDKRYIRGDGSEVWVSLTVGLARDADGAPRHFVSVMQDISARKAAEEALKQADRQKDRFIATLSHELRNPLAPLRNAADILARSGLAEERRDWAQQVIQRQTAHMARLLDDLLDLARITQGKITLRTERVPLSQVVDGALETVQPLLLARAHACEVSLPAAPAVLQGDGVRIAQILSNLLHNAARYTDAGGRIRLQARLEGGFAVISVADDGIGFAPDAAARLFDMFAQAESGRRGEGGLGIGLALVRGLVQLLGGTVSAHSDGPGRGSVFTVCLPLAQPRDATERQAPTAAAHFAGLRVLVADDNRDAAEALGLLLEHDGCQVRVADGGRAALDCIRDFRPHAAVIDIGMPDLDGYAVARRLRELPGAASLRLIALSGWGQAEDRERALAAGFDAHLTKPAELPQLNALLRTAHSRLGEGLADTPYVE